MTVKRPWGNHYDVGVPEHLEYPAISVFELLKQSALRYPDKPCTIFNDTTITYRDLENQVNRLADGLVALGLQKGDRIGLMVGNTPQFVQAFLSTLKAGGIIVAINTLYKPNEIIRQVNDAQVRSIFVAGSYYPMIKSLQSNTMIQTVIITEGTTSSETAAYATSPTSGSLKQGGLMDNLLSASPHTPLSQGDYWLDDLLSNSTGENLPVISVTPEDAAIIQYSGGTTGTSKGAIGLHRNLVANVIQFRSWLVGTKDGEEVVLVSIPLFHVYGMVLGMLLAIYTGASMVLIPNPRDFSTILNSIRKYKVSIFPGVPSIYNAINNHPEVIAGKHDLSTIKACISGSAPLLRETKLKFESLTGGKLMEGYGLSEAPTATHCNPMIGENRVGSIGLPLPDVDARIISLEDGHTELPTNTPGELVICGPQVMKGYHNLEQDTQVSLRDGWLYTGDIATMDEDGYFYIVDRKKDMIKPGGFPVWPREVEEVLQQYPKVLEAGVAGINDPNRGEIVKAWVVLKPGETATADEIRNFCQQEIAPFKVPAQVEFRTELPKNLVGKVLRRELVRQHRETHK
jgi:long-chain acyl-CoA synthetase